MSKDFQVGDRVRIKQWDVMEKEYGVDEYGDIKTPTACFVRLMRHLCGRDATIKSIDGCDIYLTDWSDTSGNLNWDYTAGMLELVEGVGNKWKQAAEFFDVEIDEEFRFVSNGRDHGLYKFTETGLIDSHGYSARLQFYDLFGGTYQIEKLPFRPKDGEKYYFVCPDGDISAAIFNKVNIFPHMAIKLGNCFRTEAEAEAHKDEMMDMLRLDD